MLTPCGIPFDLCINVSHVNICFVLLAHIGDLIVYLSAKVLQRFLNIVHMRIVL